MIIIYYYLLPVRSISRFPIAALPHFNCSKSTAKRRFHLIPLHTLGLGKMAINIHIPHNLTFKAEKTVN